LLMILLMVQKSGEAVDMENIPLINRQGFIHFISSRWLNLGFLNHQQYDFLLKCFLSQRLKNGDPIKIHTVPARNLRWKSEEKTWRTVMYHCMKTKG